MASPALVPAHLRLGQVFDMLDIPQHSIHDCILEQFTYADHHSQQCAVICISGAFYKRSPKTVANNKIRAKIL